MEAASDWIQRWSHLVPAGGTVLDVACGAGRHMRWFSERNHPVTGVDQAPAAIESAAPLGEAIQADIENGPWPLPGRRFDCVVVANYLWRPLLPTIVDSVAPGGVLLYETFAQGNESVGLVPGAGGLTYIARRAAENMAASTSKDILPFLTEGFTAAAMAKVGTSALESRKLGYLLDSDVIVPHKDELLFVAINEAKSMAASGWRAPHKRLFPVAGRSGLATIKAQLVNMRDGGFISAYDFKIGAMIAEVVCGGDVDAGSMVSEEYLLTLERKVFCHLIAQPKTHERILGMLSTGKPVRN